MSRNTELTDAKASGYNSQELLGDQIIATFNKAIRNLVADLGATSDKSEVIEKIWNFLQILGITEYTNVYALKLDEETQALLSDYDVFPEILKKFEDKTEILDLFSIVFAFFAIVPCLKKYIIKSITLWGTSLTSELSNEYNKSSEVEKNVKNIDNWGIYKSIQFLIVNKIFNNKMCLVDIKEKISNFFLTSWLPHYLNYEKLYNINIVDSWNVMDEETLNLLLTDDSFIELFLSLNVDELSKDFDKKIDQEEPIYYFIYKLGKNIIEYPKYFDNEIYKTFLEMILIENEKITDLKFNIEILMELIDHPNLNFYNENRLLLLLYLSLDKISKVSPFNIHKVLTEISPTQSVISILNISQFLLSETLIVRKPRLPSWFKSEILPPIPPISQSLFMFKENKFRDINVYENNKNLIFKNLLLILKRQFTLLDFYEKLDIQILENNDNSDTSSKINNYQIEKEFFENYFISICTTLILCEEEEDINMDDSNNNILIKKTISSKTMEVIEQLIKKFKNVAINHLLSFLSKISAEDIRLQKISIKLLNHLFFNSKNKDNIQQMCRDNMLSIQTLRQFLNVWNNGSEDYQKLYTELLQEEQPKCNKVNISVDELIDSVFQNTISLIEEENDNQSKVEEFNNNNESNKMNKPMAIKYNAAITTSFIPSVSSLHSSNNKGRVASVTGHNNNNNKNSNWIPNSSNYARNSSRTQSVHIDDFEAD